MTCGVVGHDDDCLCDVVLSSHKTRINIECGVRGMKFGEEVVRMLGYTQPWTNEDIVNYFADLCRIADYTGDSVPAPNPTGGRPRTILSPREWAAFEAAILRGERNTDARRMLKERFNKTISSSYASITAKRIRQQAGL